MTKQESGLVARSMVVVLLGWGTAVGCEAIAGYNDVEPWPREAGAFGASGASGASGTSATSGTSGVSGAGAKPNADATTDDSTKADAPSPDVSIQDGPADRDAGPCPILTGNDACATVPHFTAARQVVDGIGDEFCDVPAMVFDVNSCPTLFPSNPPDLPEKVSLRIAWSRDAFHLHVHVDDPSVVVNPDPGRLWSGDAVEIFVAGASGANLHGSYNGSNDGGAIQIVLAPPANGFPTRGQAFFNPGGSVHTSAPISSSIYAGRLVADGYELELRFPWAAFAEPAIPGNKIAFDVAIGAQQDADAGGRQLQCVISNVFVDGREACGYSSGTPAQPYCDDRTWCQPELLP